MTDKAAFYKEVYSIVKEIPAGCVTTYGEIARLAGNPQHWRMVGKALRQVSQEQGVPCHRVVNHQGRLAPAWTEQRSLLEAEGVCFKSNGHVDMKKSKWKTGI